MDKLFYVPALKINAKISDLVIDGHHIMIGDDRFERLKNRPTGRRVLRKLENTQTGQKLVIYG